MTDLDRQLQDLVTANRILAREEVVDAFGHVSIRHPERPAATSCRSPAHRNWWIPPT